LDLYYKTLSSDANFILTIFIYLENSWSKKKHEKQGRLIHWNRGSICKTEFGKMEVELQVDFIFQKLKSHFKLLIKSKKILDVPMISIVVFVL
jgi:hypothetical protein